MKKLLTLMIMLGVFLIPRYTTQAALTPPLSYDYSFAYNAVDGEFQFSDGVDTYTPEFTRTADGIYFNYEYIGDAEALLPFEVTLTFNRSNTSWTLGSVGYIATDTKIGTQYSYSGIVSNKLYVEIFNDSDNDYLYYFDRSSTGNKAFDFSNGTQYFNRFYFYNSTQFNEFILSSYNKIIIKDSSNDDFYLDAFYLKDLGTSAAVQTTTGYESGFIDGYNTGYTDGVQEDNAYSLGYALGLQEGQDMETGSSIIVLVLSIMAFALMLFGFTSKRRIFNLFASGLFIALGGILFEYPAFIIVTIGLVIVNVYYTFVSD